MSQEQDVPETSFAYAFPEVPERFRLHVRMNRIRDYLPGILKKIYIDFYKLR